MSELEFNFDKSVSTAHMRANGWGIDAFYHSSPFNSHYVYIRDYTQGKGSTRLFSINREDFKQSKHHLMPMGQLTATVTAISTKFANKAATDDDHKNMCGALMGYIKSTKPYQAQASHGALNEQLHVLLNIYPDDPRVTCGGMIRPMIFRGDSTILSVNEITALSEDLHALDKVKNPSWFSWAKPKQKGKR